jgi:hypothetical protein
VIHYLKSQDCNILGLLDGQRRLARLHGLIIIGEGGAKESHAAVAHDLVHAALVILHGRHQALEPRVEERLRLFGGAVSQHFHGPREVGEEHADPRALPFQGVPQGQDLLGEMRGGVGRSLNVMRGPPPRAGRCHGGDEQIQGSPGDVPPRWEGLEAGEELGPPDQPGLRWKTSHERLDGEVDRSLNHQGPSPVYQPRGQMG